jgi:hypothetical protein
VSWVAEGADEHEGWVANVLADGRVAGASTSGGVVVHELRPADEADGREVRRYPATDHLDVVVPWDQVVIWRVTCECGWAGGEQLAIIDSTYGTRECPEDVAERVFLPEWQAHVAPYIALAELRKLAERLRALEAEVADNVRLARGAGASWAQIGRQVGLSKQGAQQRWGAALLDTSV